MFNTFCLVILFLSNLFLIFLTLSLNGKLFRANSANLILKDSYATLLSKYNKLTRTLPKTSSPPPTKLATVADKLVTSFGAKKKSKKTETSPSYNSSSSSSSTHYDYSGGYSSCSGGDSGSSSCDSGSSGGSYD